MKRIFLTIAMFTTLAFGNPFGQGNMSIGLGLGSGSVTYSVGRLSTSENYYILGVGGDYFVFENLALGLSYRGWFGGSPTIHQASVPLTYYIPTGSKFRPYIGALYRYTYMDSDVFDNYSSVGGRAGVAILFQNGYAGLGWVQEYRLDADNLSDNTSGYPEVVIGFTF